MQTRRELAQQQLDLMEDIRSKAGINMVTIGYMCCTPNHKL